MNTARQTDSRERRLAELGKIHIYKKRLRLDDASYRDLLKRVTGLNSAADLNVAQRGQVLDEMKRLFAPAPARQPGVPAEPQIALIRGLWADCAMYGIIRDRSDRALTRFARRITKVDALQWLGAADAASVITALRAMLARARGSNQFHSKTTGNVEEAEGLQTCKPSMTEKSASPKPEGHSND